MRNTLTIKNRLLRLNGRLTDHLLIIRLVLRYDFLNVEAGGLRQGGGAEATQYFVVGRVGRDQVADYAERKGWTLAEAERWLSPNLGYDPED